MSLEAKSSVRLKLDQKPLQIEIEKVHVWGCG